MDITSDYRAMLLPSSTEESPLGHAAKKMPRGTGKPAPHSQCELQKEHEEHLKTSEASLVCPTGDSEGQHTDPEGTRTHAAEGASPGLALWIRRPAAALASTHAKTHWGKIILWTLAIIGCIDSPPKAEGALTGSKSGSGSAALAQAHMTSLDTIFRGPRLADIHPSLLDSTSDASGEEQSEPLADSKGKKGAKGSKSQKPLFSRKRRGKGNSKGTSQENLLGTQTEESEADVNSSTTGSRESLNETRGGKKSRGLMQIKMPFSRKRKGSKGSQGEAREALAPPDGEENAGPTDSSTTEGSSSDSLAEGQSNKKKKKHLKIKTPLLGKKKGKRSSKGGSREALVSPGGEENGGSTDNSSTEESSSEPSGEGQGNKKKKGLLKIKTPSPGKKKGKRSSKGGSREALVSPEGEENGGSTDNSSTEESSSEPSGEGQGNKKKKGLLKIKTPSPGKKKGKRSSKGGSREALVSPEGEENGGSTDNSSTEEHPSESATGGEDKKKKGLKRPKSTLGKKKRGKGSPLSTSQKNLPASGSDESDGGAEQPKPDVTEEIPAEGRKKKRSILKLLRSKRPRRGESGKQTIPLGVVFDATQLAQASEIGREMLGSFAASATEQKEVYEAIEAATADGDSCLKFVADAEKEKAGYFPHELQSARQGLLIYAAAERLLDDLKQLNGNKPKPLLEGITSPPTPGSTVKVLDDVLQPSEPVFTVQAVEGQMASLEGFERTVNVAKLILAPDPVEVGFVDTVLNASWNTLEGEDPDVFTRLFDFATQNGYGEALETGRKTGNFSGLLHSLNENSSVFRVVVGIRNMLGAPVPEYPAGRQASKKWKDISVKYSMFSAVEAMTMVEILQTVLLQHAFPGCLPLNAVSLMMQPSLLFARLLERFMAGSPLLGPVGQEIADNPVNKAYVTPTASPIQGIGRHDQLRSQCMAGIFAELGLNAAAVENLSCHSYWKSEQKVKGRHGYSPPAHTFSLLMRSVCSTEDRRKRQPGLLPVGSQSSCDSGSLVKASLRKDWANKATNKHRKAYRLTPHHLRIGDALRMAAFYSSDEVAELDRSVAAAWLVGKQLLAVSREQAKNVLAGISLNAESHAGPLPRTEGKPHQAESGVSGLSPAAPAPLSSEAESASLLEYSKKRPSPNPGNSIASDGVHPFVVGGNINVNAINLAATASVCRLLLETDVSNPMLFAMDVLTNLRGYISDSGAGLESAEKQRKMAKGSDVFCVMYKCFSCGFGGELLPPMFVPYASLALQVGTFLRVELEESKAVPFEKIVHTMGDGVFNTKEHGTAVKHLKKKAARFLEIFTPCMAEVEASDLLMLSPQTKSRLSLARRLNKALKRAKGKRQRANGEMCEISGEHQQLTRLLVVWWVLGRSSSESTQEISQSLQDTAATFRGARMAFAFLLFNNGHDQAKLAMEIAKAGCKNNKFVVPPNWTLGSKKGNRASSEIPFKDISKDINDSFMYLESSLGSRGVSDWLLPLRGAQQLANACGQQSVVQLADLLSTDAGSLILMSHQCIKLQDEGIKLISGVLGRRSKTVDGGYSYVLLQFLKGVNALKITEGSAGLSQAFGRYASSSDEADQQAVLAQWNGDFPNVECPWKQNKRAQEAMILKGTSYQKPAPLPVKAAAEAMEFHCPAHAALRMQDLAEVPPPATTQFCTGDSSQCVAFEYSAELQSRL